MKIGKLAAILLLIASPALADTDNPTEWTESDGSPSIFDPWKVAVSNGTLTDNGDGSLSLNTTGSGGTPGGANSNVQYNGAGAFAGDGAFNWDSIANTLSISRDSGQTGLAFRISSDTGALLANISHDGSANFVNLQLNNSLPAIEGGTGQSTYSKGDILVASDGVTLTKVTVGTDGAVLSADSSTATGVAWVALPAAGSGDITSVGDVTSGAAFDGSQGTTLTFNNAVGDATIIYDGSSLSTTTPAAAVATDILFTAGADTTTTGAGGSFVLTGGDGGPTNGAGGAISLVPGNATAGASAGGDINLYGGTSSDNSRIGMVFLQSVPLVATPASSQSITGVTSKIKANGTSAELNPNGDYTITSAPTIDNGVKGQLLVLFAANTEANIVTLQDQDTLSSSNLQLGASTRDITAKKALTLMFDGSDWVEVAYGALSNVVPLLSINIDGGGSVITTGAKGYASIPYNAIITGWDIFSDVSGSINVDIWKDTYANFPPTVTDSITGTEKPRLSSQTVSQDNALTTWTTTVSAGDVFFVSADSVTSSRRVNVVIKGQKL